MAFDFTAALNLQTNPANLNKVNKDIQKTLNKVSLNLDAKNIAKAQGEIKKLQGTLSKTTSVAKQFSDAVSLKAVNFAAYTLASTAVLKLTGAVSNATRESIKLQAELSKIAQVTNKTNSEIFSQSKLLKDISVDYNIATSKVAQLTRTLAQTGLSFEKAAAAAKLIAKTDLLATFDSLQSTTEGFIATLSSFSLTVDQAGQSLEAINAVSKRFAVESSDIVEAVRRTGGAFSAAGGNINELIALFTAVRSTSRESAETIATGFRTIFGRLQRPKTIEFFKELGIQLETAEGQFVGPLQAIQNISQGLDRLNISVGSTKFAEVVEQIGGIRQLSRVVPLLTQTEKITNALGVANRGTAESAADVAKAQETLAFQLGSLQKNFAAFIDDVVSSPALQNLASAFISIANAIVEVGRALTPLIPLFSTLAGIKLGGLLAGGIGGGLGKLAGGGKGVIGLNSGGFVPGTGNRDTVPAMLTPGEFVIRKSAAEAFGAQNLHSINKYAKGGTVANDFGSRNLSKRVVRKADNLGGTLADSAIQFNDQDSFNSLVNDVFYPSIVPEGFQGAGGRVSADQFERLVASRNKGKGQLSSGGDKNAPLDFVGSKLIEIKRTKQRVSDAEVRDKTVRAMMQGQIGGASDIKLTGRRNKVNIPTVELANDSQKVMTQQDAINIGLQQTRNRGGSISGAGTDTVPALLTPGEFVVNKKSAEAFGYGNLKQVNKYAEGGYVQKFQTGGAVSGLGGGLLGGGLGLALSGGLGGLGGALSPLTSTLVGLGTNFATLSIASGALTNTIQGSIVSLMEYKNSVKQTKEDNKKTLGDLDKKRIESIKKVEQLNAAYEKSIGNLERAKSGAGQSAARSSAFSAAESAGGKQFDKFGAGLESQKAVKKAQRKLASSMAQATAAYGKGSKEVADINRLQKKYKGSVVAQQAAVSKYVRELNQADDAVKNTIRNEKQASRSLQSKIRAEKQLALAYTKEANDLKGGGFLKKFKPSVESVTSAFQKLDFVATLAVAGMVTYINNLADASQKLSDQAVESGNSQVAASKAAEAAKLRSRASGTQSAALTLGGIGAVAGGIIGGAIGGAGGATAGSVVPGAGTVAGGVAGAGAGKLAGAAIGAAAGAAAGKLVSLIPTVGDKFSELTDFVGLTNNAEEERLARIKASNEALKVWSARLQKSAERDIQRSIQRGEGAEARASIIAETAKAQRQQILSIRRGANGIENSKDVSAEADQLAGFNEFIKLFTAQAKAQGGGSVRSILSASPDLKKAVREFEGSLRLKQSIQGVERFRKELENVALTAKIQKDRFDETNDALQMLRIATGENITVFDALGSFLSEDLGRELKELQKVQQLRINLERQQIKSSLAVIDAQEKIAEARAQFFGEGSQDQRRGRAQRDTRRVRSLGIGPLNFDQVNAELAKGKKRVALFTRSIAQAGAAGDDEAVKKFNQGLVDTQERLQRLQQAQDIYAKGIKFQTDMVIKEARARMQSIAALEDFKGGLVEEFAFGTDQQRRDLGRSAALTAQAIQQGGIQNIASEDRGTVKSFLDRLPSGAKLDVLGGRSAAQVKGEFAADEAIRAGLIKASERDQFAKAVEQQGMPLEERVGKVFEADRKRAKEAFDLQDKIVKDTLKAQQEAQEAFAKSVGIFAQAVGGAGGQQGGGQGGRQQVAGNLNVTNSIPQLDGVANALAGLGSQSGPITSIMADFFSEAANANSPDDIRRAAANANNNITALS